MGKRKTRRPIRRGKIGRRRPNSLFDMSQNLSFSHSVVGEKGLARIVSEESSAPTLAKAERTSSTYNFVRSRQLEGTIAEDPETGIWPITSQRIGYGWGWVKIKDWPEVMHDGHWPLNEPEGLDCIAKKMRCGVYQRVRSLEDCMQALAALRFPLTSFQITEDWFRAEKGAIPDPNPDDKRIGSHLVDLLRFDEHERTITFVNSWGTEWGDEGYGTLSYDYFETQSIETWIQSLNSPTKKLAEETARISGLSMPGATGVYELIWGIRDILRDEVIHACEVYDLANDERIGWAFAVPRDGFLDVEELFVRPLYRRHGYAKRLANLLLERSESLKLPLRLWVSYADCGAENRPALDGVLKNLGLSLKNSPYRWAAYVAVNGSPAAQPLNPIIIPERPAMNRVLGRPLSWPRRSPSGRPRRMPCRTNEGGFYLTRLHPVTSSVRRCIRTRMWSKMRMSCSQG